MDTTTITNNFKTEEYQINMGPQHPATHGVLRLLLTIDGEIIKKVEPDLGYIHRSIEKMCDARRLKPLALLKSKHTNIV